ncbi:hypothetical protein BCT94_10620 [Vibrio breoganii]|uniref:sulfotransferase family 2 domain-containing protein n=1 Tax=Vibrio breoganii TaxID=553239 RepID=UPI000C8331F1|nr:hypothetical protein BCT94_10620 [Vibrio breoganii]
MPITYNEKKELVLFIHIPKTGGTTVENYFNIKSVLYSDSSINTFFKTNLQHLSCDQLKSIGVEHLSEKSFMIVRNPLDKIISEYFWYRQRSSYHRLVLNFDAYVKFVFDKYKSDNSYADNHIRPQYMFELESTQVYKFEDGFESILKSIETDFDLKVFGSLKVHNKSKRKRLNILPSTLESIFNMYETDFYKYNYVKKPLDSLTVKNEITILSCLLVNMRVYTFRFCNLINKFIR